MASLLIQTSFESNAARVQIYSHTLASLLWAVISIQIIPELRITFNQSRSFLTNIAFHTVMESIRSLYRMVQYFLPKRFFYNSTSIGEQRISL